jgi:outer membrane receptor protein involved in Fe transport
LDPEQAVSASGHSVFDLSMSRRMRRGVELSFAFDNLTDRLYFETQNWFESALRGQEPAYRIHATPGYPLTVTAGLTFRFRSK